MNIKARLVLLVCLIVILLLISSIGAIFSETPIVTAKWQIDSPDNNHIGGVIKATLLITTQPGVKIDVSQLPDVGDILPLPGKVDYTKTFPHYDYPEISEGELEVVSRRISQYGKNGMVVTQIDYELQYLLPIDLSASSDDKFLPWDVPVYQSYLQFFVNSGKLERLTTKIFVEKAEFYIVPRVDENSQPIFTLFNLTPPAHWPLGRLAGGILIGLALSLLIWRGVSFLRARRRHDQIAEDLPNVGQLYQNWCENPDQAIFFEALKLYRRGIWGRPLASLWITTTFILYSGVRLSQDQTKMVFARLIKEVADEPSS